MTETPDQPSPRRKKTKASKKKRKARKKPGKQKSYLEEPLTVKGDVRMSRGERQDANRFNGRVTQNSIANLARYRADKVINANSKPKDRKATKALIALAGEKIFECDLIPQTEGEVFDAYTVVGMALIKEAARGSVPAMKLFYDRVDGALSAQEIDNHGYTISFT